MTISAQAKPRDAATQAPHAHELVAPKSLRVSKLVSEAGEFTALSYLRARPRFLERLSDGEAAVVLLALAGHGNAE